MILEIDQIDRKISPTNFLYSGNSNFATWENNRNCSNRRANVEKLILSRNIWTLNCVFSDCHHVDKFIETAVNHKAANVLKRTIPTPDQPLANPVANPACIRNRIILISSDTNMIAFIKPVTNVVTNPVIPAQSNHRGIKYHGLAKRFTARH